MINWILKYLWVKPRSCINNIGYIYSFIFLIIFSDVILNISLFPQWLSRLVLFCIYFSTMNFYVFWLALNPNSIVVNRRLLVPEKQKVKRIVEFFSRFFLFCLGSGVIWGLVPVVKDVTDLLKNGDRVLVLKQATVERSNELGVVGYLYRSVYFTGDEYGHVYFLSFAPRLVEGTTRDFLILKNSRMILEIKKPI